VTVHSVRVNDQGQKVAGYAYTPYGQTRTITGTTTGDLTQANNNPYRYTSGYLDTTSNLYKLGYRYYDPTQGRFTQQDPSGQETNHYLYAGGDPINGTDPTGLFCILHNDNGGCVGAGVLNATSSALATADKHLIGDAGLCASGAGAANGSGIAPAIGVVTGGTGEVAASVAGCAFGVVVAEAGGTFITP